MKNNSHIYIFLFFIFIIFEAKSQEKPLKNIVDDEYQNFLQVTKNFETKIPPLLYSETLQTHISTDNLVINLNQLNYYISGKSELFKKAFIRFVLGHEIGHVIQRGMFKTIAFNNIKGEMQIYFECFADIISGSLFTLVSEYDIQKQKDMGVLIDIPKFQEDSKSIMYDAYQLIMEMDKQNVAIKTHPTNLQRLTAFRNGKMIGMIDYTLRNINDPEFDKALLTESDKEKIEMMSSSSTALGYNINSSNTFESNWLLWARKEAYNIINASNDYISNLCIYNRNNKWDKSSNNPYVNFSFSVYNSNTVPVIFAGRNFIQLIPRDDKENIIKFHLYEGQYFEKLIQPNSSININGRLKWAGDDQYFPRLNLPGDEASIYSSFHYKLSGLLAIEDSQKFSADFTNWNENSIEELIDLLFFIKSKRGQFNKLKMGLGSNISQDEQNLKNFWTRFSCNFISNKNEDIFILEREKTVTCNISLFFKDFLQVDQIFKNITTTISENFSCNYQNFTVQNTEQITNIFSCNNEKIFEVTLFKNPMSTIQLISIKINE